MTLTTAPPAPAHRRPETPLRTRLATAALVLATLVAAALVTLVKPGPEHGGRPFLRSGRVGGLVDAGRFRLVVLDAAGGTRLKPPGRDLILDTTGVWVLVRVRVAATREPVVLRYARLRDERGRTFTATGRAEQPLAGARVLAPGVWVEGHVVFEVARDARELTLLLGERADPDPVLQTLAEVPIAASVPSWAAQPAPLEVPPAKPAA